ncbi:MAG: hypothetical protein FJ217_14055 [Ignavibacteria bacterium]|nr:hypothetical protein [Ignavibacteria bacterium]
MSKTKDAHVCTLLVGLEPSDIEQPLAQFQHTTTRQEDIRGLVRAINSAVSKSGEKGVADSLLDEVFDTYWPRLAKAFEATLAIKEQGETPQRSEREMLQEILELLRSQERRQLTALDDKHVGQAALAVPLSWAEWAKVERELISDYLRSRVTEREREKKPPSDSDKTPPTERKTPDKP